MTPNTRDPWAILSTPLHRFSVCPHDTLKNLYGWALLTTHLQRSLDCRIRLEPHEHVIAERARVLEGDHQLVYANPFSAVVFAQSLGFLPVARPNGVHDAAYLVARADHRPDTVAPRPVIATATDELIVHSLGLTLLPALHLDERSVDFAFSDTQLGT
jgi:phosphonate transport system substrate-binding protein